MIQIKINKMKIVVLMVLFVAIGMTTSSVFATTYEINKGHNGFNAWSDVVSFFNTVVKSGDTIIFNGTDVWENVNLVINKSVSLIGNGVTLQNSAMGIGNFAINIMGLVPDLENIKISGFNIESPGSISATSATNLTLENLNITGTYQGTINSSDDWTDAIKLGNIMGVTIDNVNIDGHNRRGVDIQGGQDYIINNTVIKNVTQNAISIALGATNTQILNSELKGNYKGEYGVSIWGGADNVSYTNLNISGFGNAGIGIIVHPVNQFISNCNIFDNYIGIVIKEGDTRHVIPRNITNVIIEACNITNNNITGIYFSNLINYDVDIVKLLTKNNITNNSGTIRNGMGSDSDWSGSGNSYGNPNILVSYAPGKTVTSPVQQNGTNTTPVPQIDKLSISNSISTQTVKNGDKLIYTITVRNSGNRASNAISINTGIPSSHANVVSHYATGTYSNGRWNMNGLGAGDTAVLVLEVNTKKSGSLNLVSTLNSGHTTLRTNTHRLTINKDVKLTHSNKVNSQTKRGKTFKLETTLKNSGNDESDKVTVRISVPKGVKVGSVSNKARYNSKNKQWTVEVKPKSSMKLSMDLQGTTKGTKNIVFNVNGKKQTKKVRIV